jgi:hypothetical protein
VAEHDEAAVCGEVLHPDRGAFFVGEVGGVFGEGELWDDGNFAIDTMRVEFEEAGDGAGCLADPAGVDAGADGFEDAGGLVDAFGGEGGGLEVRPLRT